MKLLLKILAVVFGTALWIKALIFALALLSMADELAMCGGLLVLTLVVFTAFKVFVVAVPAFFVGMSNLLERTFDKL